MLAPCVFGILSGPAVAGPAIQGGWGLGAPLSGQLDQQIYAVSTLALEAAETSQIVMLMDEI